MRDSLTYASIATMPSREPYLKQVIDALLPQVDIVNVYLNNWTHIPEFLKHIRINLAHSQDHGDLRGAGKFFWADQIAGFNLTCDDDILFPADYVARMKAEIQRLHFKAVVGAHGWRLRQPFESYWTSRMGYHFAGHIPQGLPVHGLGTGVMAYHSDTIRLSMADFRVYNMEDPTLAVLAQKRKLPLWVIDHPANWLRPTYLGDDTCFNNSTGTASKPDPAKDVSWQSTETILSWPDWQLFDPR